MPRSSNTRDVFRSQQTSSLVLNKERVRRHIIVIGASAGGVMALSELFAGFPSGMPAAIGVVLHRGTGRGELAHVLARRSGLEVVEPEERTPLKPSRIYLAPPDHHLLFEQNHVVIQRGPKEHSSRPAVDPLFRSAARHHGKRVVGVLLTGCGEDGVSGLIAVSQALGLTLAQDPDEAYMPYMPLNAVRYDDLSGVMGLKELAPALASLAGGQTVTVKRRETLLLRYGP